jgi:DmsE family decaheme c-type cytochrome
MRFRILLTILAILGVSALVTPVPVATADEAVAPAMTSEAAAIVESCSDCHDVDTPGYTHNPHSVLNMDADLAARYGVAASCNGCHGDMAEHIDSAGEVAPPRTFGDDVPATLKTDTCLQCHSDAHPRFAATTHAAAGLDCTSCHSIHGSDGAKNLPRPMEGVWQAELADDVGAANAMCSQCHGDVFAEFEWNERHRLQEGILGCNDCHSPHEPQSRIRLGGFKQEQCAQCHTDKAGPFVFEHGSVQVEGCTACHTPHGSPNRHMLKFQNVAELCFSCHAAVPSFHSRFNAETQCTNCHSSIHGSNFHEAFLK